MSESIQNIIILDLSIFSCILLFYFYKPQDSNWLIGYRTRLSMKNERNWKFAQVYFPKKWIIAIPIMLITQIPAFFGIEEEKILTISGIHFLIVSIYAIFSTEKALKKIDIEN